MEGGGAVSIKFPENVIVIRSGKQRITLHIGVQVSASFLDEGGLGFPAIKGRLPGSLEPSRIVQSGNSG